MAITANVNLGDGVTASSCYLIVPQAYVKKFRPEKDGEDATYKLIYDVAIYQNKVYECPAKKNLKIVDLTGAGDLFAAGYLHGTINNLSIQESLEKGTELSSKIIEKIGARI